LPTVSSFTVRYRIARHFSQQLENGVALSLSFIGFGEKCRLRNSEIEVFGKLVAGSDARDKVNAN
jgi:hypothetical protein